MKTTISTRLMHTLYGGKKRLGSEALLRLSRFVESQKTEGDTFVNKSGEVDLYYTSFGWLLSYVLGIDLSMEKRRSYLEKQPVMSLDLVHYAAYMRCVLLHWLMKEGKFRFLLGAMRPMPIRVLLLLWICLMMTYGLLIPGLFGCLYWKIHKIRKTKKRPSWKS